MSSSESDVLLIQLHNEDDGERYMNTPVVFKGANVGRLDAGLFANCSARFRRELFGTCARTPQSPVEFMSDVTRDTVLLFVAACNGERVEIEKKDALEMLSLAEEWEVRKMIDIMAKFSDAILVASLVSFIERGKETRNLEEQLHSRFIQIIKNEDLQKELFKLGLEVLQRIFSMGCNDLVRDHFSEVFPFMKQCVDEHFGSCASVLFIGANVREWNDDIFEWMETTGNFDHSFLGNSYFKTVREQNAAIDDLRRKNMEQEALIHNRLISEKEDLVAAIIHLKEELAKKWPL